MNKKGFLFDLGTVLVLLFVFAISVFTGYVIYQSYVNSLVGQDLNSETQNIIEQGNIAMKIQDYGFLLLFVTLIIFLVISAFMIKSNPIFFFMSLSMLIIFVIIAVPFSNAFEVFGNATNTTADVYTAYPITKSIMDNMPFIIAMIGFILLGALYIKRGGINEL